jgi:ribosomal protein S18 acetylase RimI-like enzyme
MLMDADQTRFRYEVIPRDSETIGRMVVATKVFNRAEEAIAVELVEDRLQKGEKSEYLFVLLEQGDAVLGYTCFGPIPATNRRYEIYWIAVDPEQQNRGLGRRILLETEHRVRTLGGVRLYVETSSREDYEPTRRFYALNGYSVAGELQDYHDIGDNLVIYAKDLLSDPGRADHRSR